MADLPDTRLHSMPDHVPIDVDIMRQYARCAVDSCAVNQKAVYWGKVNRQNPVMPTSPDSFNSNGFTNCQADGMGVSCDPPKLLPILPAVCLAKINTGNSTGYYDNYGKTLPAMSGKTYFQNTTHYVNTPAGFSVGQQLAGPVKVLSNPVRFKSAVGYIDASTTNILVITELGSGSV